MRLNKIFEYDKQDPFNVNSTPLPWDIVFAKLTLNYSLAGLSLHYCQFFKGGQNNKVSGVPKLIKLKLLKESKTKKILNILGFNIFTSFDM